MLMLVLAIAIGSGGSWPAAGVVNQRKGASQGEIMKLARRHALPVAGAAAATLWARRGFAQSYPVRPVRVIVPFAPGGVTDVVARIVASKLAERLGKQFYVENLAGGSGNIGMGQAA